MFNHRALNYAESSQELPQDYEKLNGRGIFRYRGFSPSPFDFGLALEGTPDLSAPRPSLMYLRYYLTMPKHKNQQIYVRPVLGDFHLRYDLPVTSNYTWGEALVELDIFAGNMLVSQFNHLL